MQYQKKSKHKKVVIIVAIVVVLAVAAFLVYFFFLGGNHSSKSTIVTSGTSSTRATNSVDYSGPSAEDTANSQDAKKNDTTSTNSTTKASDAQVLIAFADVVGQNVEIRASSPSVVEGDGTCTATLAKDGQTVTGKSLAFVAGTSSQCRPIDIPLASFPTKGVWSLTVQYSSAAHSGTSDPAQVTVS